MTTPLPPEEVFCMICGPGAVLEREPLAPVLNCPQCWRSVRVPGLPLFVVTGASGAASVAACDIDSNAVAAIGINASANDAAVSSRAFDLADGGVREAEVVLAADVFYQRELAELALRFLRAAAGSGADVLVADPGRAFLPAAALTSLTSYRVPVLSVLEDVPVKNVTVYRLRPAGL